MTRAEFEHAIRAAASILGVEELLVIGSQALHASVDNLPEEAQRSVEIDIAIFGDTDGSLADLVEGSIGEASMFHATFGYYVQGVVESTAVLPDGWRERLIPFATEGTRGVSAQCLEPHDLWIAKAIANRPKDIEFCDALIERSIVDPAVLASRLDAVPELDDRIEALVRGRIERAAG